MQAALSDARRRNKINLGTRKSWKVHGPYLAAGLAAAARAPDAKVLELLHEAAAATLKICDFETFDIFCSMLIFSIAKKRDHQKIWGPLKSFWLGSHSLFYTDGQPEWTEFQARMQGVGDDGRAEDREAWAALGEEMTNQFVENWKEAKYVRILGKGKYDWQGSSAQI